MSVICLASNYIRQAAWNILFNEDRSWRFPGVSLVSCLRLDRTCSLFCSSDGIAVAAAGSGPLSWTRRGNKTWPLLWERRWVWGFSLHIHIQATIHSIWIYYSTACLTKKPKHPSTQHPKHWIIASYSHNVIYLVKRLFLDQKFLFCMFYNVNLK